MGEIFNTEIRWKRFSISLRDHFLLTAPALEKSEKKCRRIRSAEEKKMSTNQEEPRRTFRMTHPPKLRLVHNIFYFAAIILPTTFFKRFSALVIIWVLYKRMVPTIYVDSNPLLHILSHSSQYTYFLSSGPHSFTFLGGYDLSFFVFVSEQVDYPFLCTCTSNWSMQWDSSRIGLIRLQFQYANTTWWSANTS